MLDSDPVRMDRFIDHIIYTVDTSDITECFSSVLSPNLRTLNPGFNPGFTPFYITNAGVNPGLNPVFGVLASCRP
jgi:hypothetical protein